MCEDGLTSRIHTSPTGHDADDDDDETAETKDAIRICNYETIIMFIRLPRQPNNNKKQIRNKSNEGQ